MQRKLVFRHQSSVFRVRSSQIRVRCFAAVLLVALHRQSARIDIDIDSSPGFSFSSVQILLRIRPECFIIFMGKRQCQVSPGGLVLRYPVGLAIVPPFASVVVSALLPQAVANAKPES